MAIRPFRFEVAEARSFKHPHFPNIQKHIFLVPAARLPKNIPQKANLREATGMGLKEAKERVESVSGTARQGCGTSLLLAVIVTVGLTALRLAAA